MKNSSLLLTTACLLGCFAANVHADDYAEMLAFSDGSTATLNFSFDLATGYYTNINGTVSGSPNLSANGTLTEELGTYIQFATYTPETPASQNVLESPGNSFALFNSNNATDWSSSPAIFEYFVIQNNQLALDIAGQNSAAATLYYPDQLSATTNLNINANNYLIDITANPGIIPTGNLNSAVPLPSSLLLFASAILSFAVAGTKKSKFRTAA